MTQYEARGGFTTNSVRKATNSAEVCRGAVLPSTLPVLVLVRKAMSRGAPLRERQYRIEPIERLDGGFLIDAKHRRVLRPVQVQPDDVRRLPLEVWIVLGHMAIKPMRGRRPCLRSCP